MSNYTQKVLNQMEMGRNCLLRNKIHTNTCSWSFKKLMPMLEKILITKLMLVTVINEFSRE